MLEVFNSKINEFICHSTISVIKSKSIGCNTESITEICNALNDYFINVGNNLEIEHINHVSVDHEIINNSLFFKPINSDDIMLHLNKIKDYNYLYENNLSNYILKKHLKPFHYHCQSFSINLNR